MDKANLPTKTLPIELPRIDADTQSRIAIDEDTVGEYADLITDADGEWPCPPIDVFFDGTDHTVADGFHRLLAALRTKRGSIPCTVRQGTAKDARIFGMTANDHHGLRMTRADKRACVEWLLVEGGKMTQAAIAKAAGVSVRTVRTVVADRKYEATPSSPPEVGRQTSATPSGGEEADPIDVDSVPVDDDNHKLPSLPGDERSTAGSLRERHTCPSKGVQDALQAACDAFPDDDSPADYGKCPNCEGTEWENEDGHGVACVKCCHPHGEPTGDEPTKQTPDEPDAPESAGTWLRDHMGPVVRECKKRFPDVSAYVAACVLETLTADWE